jgi:putative SOS response-associated peptidase YedK
MCFSVNVNLIKEELESRYDATLIDRDKYRPSYYYHAFGLPEIPAICSGDPGKIRLLRWGLVPSWVKTLDEANKIRFKTFNARSESLEEKPSFSASFKSKRCIIPVKGFYEWQHLGKEKIPWYIYHSGNEILSMAGLYNEWVESKSGEILNTFTIVTTDANDLMAEIHNSAKRMPVILDKKDEKTWIDVSVAPEEALSLLKPCPSELLKAHTISNLINDKSADKNTPEVNRPYNYNPGNLLF